MSAWYADESAFFWEGSAAGELRVQQCSGCATVFHPPRPTCSACGSYSFGYVVLSGRGTVFSHVVVHRPLAPPRREPFVVGLIEVEHGIRLVAEVVADDPDQVSVGSEVAAGFSPLQDGRNFPQFRLIDEGVRDGIHAR